MAAVRGREPPARRVARRVAVEVGLLEHALKLHTTHAGFVGEPTALAGLQELLLFFTHAAVCVAKLAPSARPGPLCEALK